MTAYEPSRARAPSTPFAVRGREKASVPAGRRVWRVALAVGAALLAVLLVAYAVASAYMAISATRATRIPIQGTPADLGLAYEPVTFESAVDHVPLRGWYLPSRGERAIVLLHGIDSNRWDPWPSLPQKAKIYVDNGFDVLTFDLRAHGESGGEHMGLGWLERRDVQGAVRLVEQRGIAPGRIGIHGNSYGAGTALLSTAAIPDVAAVISDSAFADQRLLLDREINRRTGLPPIFTPGISAFASLFYGLDLAAMPPELAVPQIAPRPILFIHGTADTRIPVDHAYRLKAASRNPADELWIVPGAVHVQAFAVEPDLYATKVVAFFDRHVP